MAAIDTLSQAFFKALKPPPKLSLSEWADRFAYLSAESSAESGRWHTLPYQKGIMDAITDPRIEQISVMKSARVGYTKIINHAIGYHVHQDPCSIMVVQPTIEDAGGYSKEEIAPMLRDTPCLQGLVSDAKAKNSENTILQKMFPGGTLGIVGANSPRGFRRVSRRIVIFDEVDGYPPSAGAEGDQIKLGIRRTEYFWNRKIVSGSTPTIKDHSRIERLFYQGDKRRFFVPCPHCGDFQFFKWKNLQWPDGRPREAFFVCETNGCAIEHKDKRAMIEKGFWHQTIWSNGEWIKEENPLSQKHVSFHIWAAYSYSPNATWGDLASEFLEAKKDVESLKTFVNTVLGEVWEDQYSSKVEATDLKSRAEVYPLNVAPEKVIVAVAGVDIQDNRFAILRWGFGREEESFIISYQEIYGDPTLPDIWNQLSNVLLEPIEHETYGRIQTSAAGIDSGGHFTHEVYQFTRHHRGRHWIAVKGSSLRNQPVIAKPRKVDINFRGQAMKKGAELYAVGSDTIKNTIYGRLKHNQPGPGFIHFSHELTDEFYEQLTAEKQVTRFVKGFPIKEWTKKPGQRNEVLDCAVYGYAALHYYISRFNRSTFWDQMQKSLAEKAKTLPNNNKEPQNNDKKSAFKPKKRGFVSNY
jgi:phage terminase large subunit GpA-like protein